ncbi:TPA: replication protein, partial [Pasteurella multocida]
MEWAIHTKQGGRAMTSKFIPNSFQVPNAVIDDLMSQMSGAELKCYLAVIRKTKGWNKEEDAISITQLMEVTGLSNRKVIDACNSLVEIGLLNQKTGARNTKIFSINWCKKFTSEESSLVKKVHGKCEESSLVTSEESSHTKNNIKNTPTNNINTAQIENSD